MADGPTALERLDTGPTGTPVGEALTIDTLDQVTWDEECDVLVVGCGLAGAVSALKAAEDETARITIIDRFDGGGASQQSAGILYLGGGTRAQQEVGMVDSVDGMADYLSIETGNVIGRATLERFCRESASIIPWLEQFGVHFGGPMTEDKVTYHRTAFLYYSGNERLGESVKIAPPAARGHRTMPSEGVDPTKYSGHHLMVPLKRALDNAVNVDFQRRTAASRLIRDGYGRIIGAEVRQIRPGSFASRLNKRLMQANGNMTLAILGVTRPMLALAVAIERTTARVRRIRARHGVILAAGGYVHNPRMLAQLAPTYRHVAPLGTLGDDGSAIMLGHSVGAATERMDRVSAWRFLFPPEGWIYGALVGPDGRRMVNEEAYGARVGAAIFERAGGLAWLILDHPMMELVRKQATDPERMSRFKRMTASATLSLYAKIAPTLAALAAKVGLPVDAFLATIEGYNADIVAQRADEFGKASTYRIPIVTPPFTAMDMSYRTRFNPVPGISVGGLKVDEATGTVIDRNGRPIAGLFAAGRTAVGLPSNLYVSGLSLSDCVWSGWRAARSAGIG